MTDPIIDRDAIIEKAAKAAWGTVEDDPLPWEKASKLARIAARVAAKDALQSIADDLLAPIEAIHYAAYNDTDRTPLCDQCHGKAGVHECGCWADTDVQPVCGTCWQGYKFVPVDWPCPTAQAVAAIREAVRA